MTSFMPVLLAALAAGTAKPPAAWIATTTGHHRLAWSSYCWTSGGTSVCADYIRPRCGDGRTPTVRVRRGERVRFVFGFEPRRVSVTSASGTAVSLARRRRPTWRVNRTGVIVLFATAKPGDASYAVCIVFRRS